MYGLLNGYGVACKLLIACIFVVNIPAQQTENCPSKLVIRIVNDFGCEDMVTLCRLDKTAIRFCRSSIGPNKCNAESGISDANCDLRDLYSVARELSHFPGGDHTLEFAFQDPQGKRAQFMIRTSIAEFQESTSGPKFKLLLDVLHDSLNGHRFNVGATFDLIDTTPMSDQQIGIFREK